MTKNFQQVEDVLADEDFQAWVSGQDTTNWEQWLSRHPEQLPLVQEATAFMNDLRVREQSVSPAETATAYKLLQARLSLTGQQAKVVPVERRRTKWWLGAAAAVLLLFAGITYWQLSPGKPTVNTQYGEVSTHQLPDGSTIMLNANSSAKLGSSWKEDADREVWLNGEAFFHIRKNETKNRFIVHTNDLDVIVTGTQFNVWTRDNKTSVLLTEGSVTIRTPDGKETKMLPGDFVEINNETNLEKKKVNEETILAWRENKLVFDKTSMAEAARIITEHYGVKVVIAAKELESKTLNGMMPNDNLDVLLRTLEATNDFKITRKDGEIMISKP